MKRGIFSLGVVLTAGVLAPGLASCTPSRSERPEAMLARYVGRVGETRRHLTVYKRSLFGRLAAPAGEWPLGPDERVVATLEPGVVIEVRGIASRRLETGLHHYLTCRSTVAGAEVTFDYLADERFVGPSYIIWR